MPERIEDYALVGDGETAALLSRNGSVDWLCWPRFDSDACFAALLGTPQHGRWLIAPRNGATRITRRYVPDTLVLETEIETAHGRALMTDFMPPRGGVSDLIRIVRGLEGRVPMRTELIIRFGYGTVIPWVTQRRGGPETELRAIAGPDMLTLRTQVKLRGEDHRTTGEFTVGAGETITFVMSYSASHVDPPPPIDVMAALDDTLAYWRDWSGKCRFEGPWREAVVRSLITLKSLIYAPTGGIVAAATTSLPERIGGVRNWDYRFCWLRDATFTLLSLMNAGYYEEAQAWRGWLVRALAGAPDQAQIMYGVAGERRLTEWEIDWLPGFEHSRPVRVGNAAARQLQLDVYGEIADAFHHARLGGLAPAREEWAVQRALTAHLEKIWSEPDEGIWEVRGRRQQFTYSKVMAWVALDRAIKAIETYRFAGPLARWRELRERIHAEVCARGFNPRLGSFVQAFESDRLDASLLMIPLVGFLPASDARVRGTLDAVGRHLMVDGLVRRYHTSETEDGLPPGEGAFLACSFWYVDNLALAGRHAEARAMFEHLLTLRNDVGLLAEQYDAHAQRQLGNFPQAFSHVALIGSAHNLSANESPKPAEQRGASGAQAG
ncbi:MAG TPA: glycoside hydrolase family 15 protein [Steroidobacteraceae bacterium]|nr:glycoside hydrolase family 15 protein [Steroidobacteraceae bacterium]